MRKKVTILISVMALAFPLGLCWQAAGWRAEAAEAEMREVLLRLAVEIARSINPGLVKQLTFTTADRGTPAFEHIREQMIMRGRTFPQGGIYSLALRNKILLLGPENYDADDSMASPPGTVYQNPAPEHFEVFTTGRPCTIDSHTNESGGVVSALAPVLDPSSGKVLMTIGIDVLAADWQSRLNAARGGPLLTALAFILMFLAGGIGLYFRNLRQPPDTIHLRSWIVAPVAIVLLGGMGFWAFYQYLQAGEQMRLDMARLKEQSRSQWNSLLAFQGQILKGQIDRLDRNPSLATAWQQRDMGRLSELTQPIASELRREFKITHLYFVAPDHTCLLGVLDPVRQGDRLDHHTLLTAAGTREDARGIEMDIRGGLTLRYVRPWIRGGRLLGYLDLGMELDPLLHKLALDLNLELLTVIRKKFTGQERLTAGNVFNHFGVAQRISSEVMAELKDRLQPFHGEEMLQIRQGERLLCATVIPQLDSAGTDVAALVVLRDITADISRSRSILVLNLSFSFALAAGLLALLWETSGTAARQLAARAGELQRSNADLEQFAVAVSHDLRQPLRMVGSYLQILEKELQGKLDENNSRCFHYAIEGAKRMDGIVQSMLDYALVGDKGTAKERLQSREILAEALDFLEPDISRAGAEIRVHGEWSLIRGYRHELVRLFQNLISNAVKFRGDGRPPLVEISATRADGDVLFSLRDNGIGIDSAHLHRLFQLFFRLHSQARYKGAGIGLAICRKIVEHHGGRIWVESQGEGQGSIFHFTIPSAED